VHPLQICALLALSGFALYRQSTPSRVQEGIARFWLPLIYAGIGLLAGGFGEILVLIALMMIPQIVVVRQRAKALARAVPQ